MSISAIFFKSFIDQIRPAFPPLNCQAIQLLDTLSSKLSSAWREKYFAIFRIFSGFVTSLFVRCVAIAKFLPVPPRPCCLYKSKPSLALFLTTLGILKFSSSYFPNSNFTISLYSSANCKTVAFAIGIAGVTKEPKIVIASNLKSFNSSISPFFFVSKTLISTLTGLSPSRLKNSKIFPEYFFHTYAITESITLPSGNLESFMVADSGMNPQGTSPGS